MGYDRKDFRDDLNDIFGDSSDNIWTEAQKNSAINQAIDALWPEVKDADEDTVTLVADTFVYTPSASSTLVTEMGYSQIYLEQDSDEPYQLMRRIVQRPDGGVIKIEVPDDIVDASAGDDLRLHYHKKFVHYSDDSTAQDVPYLPVLYYAAMMLCVYMLQKAGSMNVVIWQNQIPVWEARWAQAKKDNLVVAMSQHVGFKRA